MIVVVIVVVNFHVDLSCGRRSYTHSSSSQGERVRLVHDTFQQMWVLPRVRHLGCPHVGFLRRLQTAACGPDDRTFLAGAAMNGFFAFRTVLGKSTAQTKFFVDDLIFPIRGTVTKRRRLAMGALLRWCSVGHAGVQKNSSVAEAAWIGNHHTVNSVVNKVEILLPAKKNAEIHLKKSWTIPRDMIRRADVRRLAGRCWVVGF